MAFDTIEVERTPDGALEFSVGETPEPPPDSEPGPDHNVGSLERGVSVVGGSALLVRGLRRGDLRGFGSALLGGALLHRGTTGRSQVYRALGIDASDEHVGELGHLPAMIGRRREIRMEAVATVDRPPDELYRFWRDPLNLPRFMKSLSSVNPLGDRRAGWALKPPVGPALHFETELTHDTVNHHIGWRSEASAVVDHIGEVWFREVGGGRGTEVRLKLDFTPPGGIVGAGFGKLFDGPMEMQLRTELKRFKQLMETGEIATTEGQPSGRRH